MPAARPTAQDLERARGGHVPDLVPQPMRLLLCGINPSLWSVAVGHHFARPGNRFWRALHDGGLTPRLLRPEEEHVLASLGIGITNIAARGTARADELTPQEILEGRTALERKVAQWRPGTIAFLGVTAYRVAFQDRTATVGPQEQAFAGADVWVLPNPSGLNAHWQRPDLARIFGELAAALSGR